MCSVGAGSSFQGCNSVSNGGVPVCTVHYTVGKCALDTLDSQFDISWSHATTLETSEWQVDYKYYGQFSQCDSNKEEYLLMAQMYPASSCFGPGAISDEFESSIVLECDTKTFKVAGYMDSMTCGAGTTMSEGNPYTYDQLKYSCPETPLGFMRSTCNYAAQQRHRKTPKNAVFAVLLLLVLCPFIIYGYMKIFYSGVSRSDSPDSKYDAAGRSSAGDVEMN